MSAAHALRRAVAALVPATPLESIIQDEDHTITLPPAIWRRITGEARRLEVTRSSFLAFTAALYFEFADEARPLALPLAPDRTDRATGRRRRVSVAISGFRGGLTACAAAKGGAR